jgi:hypothetical protein
MFHWQISSWNFLFMYDTTYIVLRSFAHLSFQNPSITYFDPSGTILPGFDSVHHDAGVLFDGVLSHLRDVHAASLYPCAPDGIFVDMFHVLYSSLCDIIFHVIYSSLCDITTSLSSLYRDVFVHAVLMHCIPQEEPGCRVQFIFLMMMRSMILRHDFLAHIIIYYVTQLTFRTTVLCHEFLARITAFYARQWTFHSNVCHRLYHARGSLRLIDLGRFSLPWLFIITSVLAYHCPSLACFSRCFPNKGDSMPSTSHSFSCDDQAFCDSDRVLTYGGGRQHEFSQLEVKPYITLGNYSNSAAFVFVGHVNSLGQAAYPIAQNFIHTNIPLRDIIHHLPVKVALKIARLHHLEIGSHVAKSEICRAFEDHDCCYCHQYLTVFALVDSNPTRRRIQRAEKKSENLKNMKPDEFSKLPDTTPFPPPPVDNDLSQKIINDFCIDSSPSAMEEAGCAVCGQLVPVSQLTRLKGVKNLLHVLEAKAVTRFERSDVIQSIREYKGPVLDHACNKICNNCRQKVRNGKVPHCALANGLWLGAVPEILSSLTYVEKLLVARVRVNSCFF